MTASHRCRRVDDPGTITAFVVVLSSALLMITGLVLDGGLALATEVDALGAAQEAARTGAQQLDLTTYRHTGELRLDLSASTTAAHDYLVAAGYAGTVIATTQQVTVTITAHQPTQLLSLIGVHELTVQASARARPRLAGPP